MTPFIEAATVAGFDITAAGVIWIVWRVVAAYRGKQWIWYHYEDDDD